jgi:D-inositol-3-phosphate glycosyltransferase
MRLLRSRAHLLVIGGEDGNSELKKAKRIASNLGIADRVTFLGAQPQAILPYYYSAAEVCVLPSRYESFGLVVLEAMACGTPVIASRVGGIPEVVDEGETGFLITPGDEEEIADKIDWLMEDERRRSRMSLQARERAKEFGWDRVARKVASVYDGYAS